NNFSNLNSMFGTWIFLIDYLIRSVIGFRKPIHRFTSLYRMSIVLFSTFCNYRRPSSLSKGQYIYTYNEYYRKYNRQINSHFYSHSIVAGGLELISNTTLFTPFTLLIISLDTLAKNSYGKRLQSAVIPSVEVTARKQITCSYVRSSPITPTDWTGKNIAPACHTVLYNLSFFKRLMKISSASCNIATFSGVMSPKIRIANPGPGKG